MSSPQDRAQALRRLRNRLVRPAFYAFLLGTLAGNVAQAQPTWGGWLAAVVAPLAYLVCSEVLFRVVDVPPSVRLWGGGILAVVGLLALYTSYSHLLHFAEGVGWDIWTAWTFPVLLDVVVLLMTVYLIGIGRQLSYLELPEAVTEVERSRRGGRPRKPEIPSAPTGAPEIPSAPTGAPEIPSAPVTVLRSVRPSAAQRNASVLRERYGDRVPSYSEIVSDLRWGAGKTSAALKALQTEDEPEQAA